MIALVDTSVWIDHLRRGNRELVEHLDEGQVHCHRFVVGEIACGTLGNRQEILSLLSAMPQVPMAEHDEVIRLVSDRELAGRGLGWVDVHLLASSMLAKCRVWTLDKALAAAAADVGLVSE